MPDQDKISTGKKVNRDIRIATLNVGTIRGVKAMELLICVLVLESGLIM